MTPRPAHRELARGREGTRPPIGTRPRIGLRPRIGTRPRIGLAATALTLFGVLLVGCTQDDPGPAPRWPAELGRQLAPTGMTLAGGTGNTSVVVDGDGRAWVDGPWQVSRVDPASGEGTNWDAADDSAFAGADRLAGSRGAGVWLISESRAALFDGSAFLLDLEVPQEYRSDSGRPQGELLELEESIWVAGDGGVGRWSEGEWSPVGEVGDAGPLAVDTEGRVWVGASSGTGDEARGVVAFWDGSSWVSQADSPQGIISDLAADPDGGIWAFSGADGTQDHGIWRFDGSRWQRVGPGGYGLDLQVASQGEVWAMVSAAGAGVDPADQVVPARLGDDGSWETFLVEEVAGSVQSDWPRLAMAGDVPVVTTRTQLWRWSGQEFSSMWRDPTAVVAPGSALLAVSGQETLVDAQREVADAQEAFGWGLSRWRDGAWQEFGPRTQAPDPVASMFPAATASDGATWVISRDGLVRIEADREEVVDAELTQPATLASGSDGSVWTLTQNEVLHYDADGSRSSIGAPSGQSPLIAESPLATTGETVWLANIAEGVATWDGGSWEVMDLPGEGRWITQMLTAADGALWAVLTDLDEDVRLGRFAQGRWTMTQEKVRGLARGTGNHMCTARQSGDVACYDEQLSVVGSAAVGDWAIALALPADGSVWVLGEQVARLAGSLQ